MKNRALKSTLSIVIAFLLTLTCCASPLPAGSVTDFNEAQNTTAYISAQTVLSGMGTKNDPYVIDSPSAFLNAASLINDRANKNTYGKAVYSITACLNFDGFDFVPWGTSGAPFNGVLYGNGHKLYNIALVDTVHFGVVGYMENGRIDGVHAEYKDDEYSVTEMTNFGGIAAIVIPSAATPNANITQCSVKGDITIDTDNGIVVGGIYSSSTKQSKSPIYIEDCVSYINLTVVSSGTVLAGIVVADAEGDSANPFSFTNCISYGDINVTANSGNIGGFAGVVNGEQKGWSDWVDFTDAALAAEVTHLKNCVSFGNVTANVNVETSLVGKLVAYDSNDTTIISNCAYNSSATVTTNCIENKKMGTAHTLEKLQSQAYMSSKFGFDFDNTWTMGNDGVMTLKNVCTDCVTDPYISLTDSTVTVNGYKGELAVAVFSGLVLEKIVFVPVASYRSLSYSELGLLADTGDTVKAFMFETGTSLKPLAQSVSLVVGVTE